MNRLWILEKKKFLINRLDNVWIEKLLEFYNLLITKLLGNRKVFKSIALTMISLAEPQYSKKGCLYWCEVFVTPVLLRHQLNGARLKGVKSY
jgi:hypothetical protein